MDPQSQNQPDINDELDGENLDNQGQTKIAPKTLSLINEFDSALGEQFMKGSSNVSESKDSEVNNARQVQSSVVDDLEIDKETNLVPLVPTQQESGLVSQPIGIDSKKYEEEIEALRQLLFGAEIRSLRQQNQELQRKVNQLEETLSHPEQLKHLLAPVILAALQKEAKSASHEDSNRAKLPSQPTEIKPNSQQKRTRKQAIIKPQNNPIEAPQKEVINAKSNNYHGVSTPLEIEELKQQLPTHQRLVIKEEINDEPINDFVQVPDNNLMKANQNDFESKPIETRQLTAPLPNYQKSKFKQEKLSKPNNNLPESPNKNVIETRHNDHDWVRKSAEIKKSSVDNQTIHQSQTEENSSINFPQAENETQSSARISKKSRSSPILLLILLSLFTVGGLGVISWRMYREYTLERNLRFAFASHPELSVYNLKANSQGKNLALTGILPSDQLRSQAEEFVQDRVSNKQIYNDIIVVEPSLEQVASQVENVLAMFNQIEGINLKAEVQNRTVTVEGVAVQLTDLNAIIEAFGQIPGVKQVNNKVTNRPSSIATRVYFGNNSAQIVLQDARVKILPIKQLMLKYPALKLKVIGHTHENEGGDNAQKLALERAQAVQLVLEDQGIDRRRTEAVGIVGSPGEITPNQPIWLSRCVLFEIIE